MCYSLLPVCELWKMWQWKCNQFSFEAGLLTRLRAGAEGSVLLMKKITNLGVKCTLYSTVQYRIMACVCHTKEEARMIQRKFQHWLCEGHSTKWSSSYKRKTFRKDTSYNKGKKIGMIRARFCMKDTEMVVSVSIEMKMTKAMKEWHWDYKPAQAWGILLNRKNGVNVWHNMSVAWTGLK